jgi:3-oxo-4-pregnene-20-carboxyl-CoA dehydrogenase beta subunit
MPDYPDEQVSGEDRQQLRRSLRQMLKAKWLTSSTVENARRASQPEALQAIYHELIKLGLSELGKGGQQGGLRELLLVLEELGRFDVPAPFLGTSLFNLHAKTFASDDSAIRPLVRAVASGERRVVIHLGEADGDLNAGSIAVDDRKAEGLIHFVEELTGATDLLAYDANRQCWAWIDLSAGGVNVADKPGLATPAYSSVHLSVKPAAVIADEIENVRRLRARARLCLAARSLGEVDRGFELLCDYAKSRTQFGQVIGQFQAVQHKLANNYIALAGVRLILDHAADCHDRGNQNWPAFAHAAFAYASSALRRACLENHHIFGAIGYSEEHPAYYQFKRVHSDLFRYGGVVCAREELAVILLDDGKDMPDYDLGEAGNELRLEGRDWLRQNWTEAGSEKTIERLREKLAEKGYFKLSWPKEFGGLGCTPMEQFAFRVEMERAEVPIDLLIQNEIQAHAIMRFGSKAQQQEFLPKIANGEIKFCLGYSEPNAGSDLASLKTTAVRSSGEWIISGQKSWTTKGDEADYMWLAARTNPKAIRPQAGISIFVVPMDAPGITVRPSMALYGETFCEELLENVRIPDDALIGEVNQGWQILSSALATERLLMGGYVVHVRSKFSRLAEAIRRNGILAANGAVRDKVGQLAAELEVASQLAIRTFAGLDTDRSPVCDAAVSSVVTSELMQSLGETSLEILGSQATLSSTTEGAIPGDLERMLRLSIMMVVGGGTNEILRNLIARNALGLARGPDAAVKRAIA